MSPTTKKIMIEILKILGKAAFTGIDHYNDQMKTF
jgi:hypothetical protein